MQARSMWEHTKIESPEGVCVCVCMYAFYKLFLPEAERPATGPL